MKRIPVKTVVTLIKTSKDGNSAMTSRIENSKFVFIKRLNRI